MWLESSKDIDKKIKFFLKMSRDKYDKYMCKTYPDFFSNRNLPKTESCMYWGFDIGPGWYWILSDLCRKLTIIQKASGIGVTFTQIKEKFAGGRFYNNHRCIGSTVIEWNAEENDLWDKIIDNEVNSAQDLCEYVCAKCGEYKHDVIYIGRWAYEVCEKCLLKERPDIKEALEDWRVRQDIKHSTLIWDANKKELASLKKINDNISSRLEKEQKALMKKYEANKGIRAKNKEDKK